jgi:hypothetical protein
MHKIVNYYLHAKMLTPIQNILLRIFWNGGSIIYNIDETNIDDYSTWNGST